MTDKILKDTPPTISVTFVYPQDYGVQLTQAACGLYGYQTKLPDGTDNPQTPTEFTSNVFIRFGVELVASWQSKVAAEAARQAALAQVAANIDTSQIGVVVA